MGLGWVDFECNGVECDVFVFDIIVDFGGFFIYFFGVLLIIGNGV